MLETPGYILRRAEFILSEARWADRHRDQTVTFAMRVISNWVAVGSDVNSREVKRRNPRMSGPACKLRRQLEFVAWCKETINEHPEPLSVTWNWACANATEITPTDVIQRFQAHPMITITKAEDDSMKDGGFRAAGDPATRYAHAGIELCACERCRGLLIS